ncbi:DUF1800 domain-containing protein [Portibacter lacus]|uniref:DUF1800 domain-containing protein n=1 Tax=Portibacter lacus TaxID=1099794 RepID=A0AA37SQJ9_9BACT|nr:DUF1800 family protein [Portibacter lacus]GLR17091.1 hypothetical protein GCM10007940_17060 [Portibacter lacus]
MSTLNPYTGNWDSKRASFLLGRTIYGKTKAEIEETVSLGLEQTLDKLFEESETPAPPIHHKFEDDPDAPIGTTWVDKYYPLNDIQGLRNARRNSVIIWQTGLLQENKFSLLEKMVLFWHEHFPVNDINLGEVSYEYLSTIRAHALGNFRTLTEKMTLSPAMLIFLNGNQNNKESPNENYARELLELFTIGRGEAVGDGDYTNYTETDIVEIAKALTGWKARISETGFAEAYFLNFRHDTTNKQLSARFDNVVIPNEGEEEYKKVIEIILAKREVARHICRQLHIWFVGANIDDDVEMNIINPMADIMYVNDYDIKKPLRALLASEYFHSEVHRGCMLSSPLDFLYKSINTFEIKMPEDIISKYYIWEAIAQAGALLEMVIMNVPSVAGWKAYYQAPGYYQFWINSVTLGFREEVANALIVGNEIRGFRLGIDALEFISKIDNASDPNLLIKNIADLIFEFPLSQNQSDYLKEVLIPGLPDFEWTVEYGKYLENPEDLALKISVYTKVATLLATMMKMPEYYLM